jgi:hypothetical protein
MIRIVRVRSTLEQCADERQRAVVDRVLEAVTDRRRSTDIRKALRAVQRGAQTLEVTDAEGGIDPREDRVGPAGSASRVIGPRVRSS